MELSKIIPLLGIGIAFAGGLAYYATIAVLRIGQAIDAAIEESLDEALSGIGLDDE